MAGPLTKVGRYQIVGELGRGSMGVVFQGFDPVIGRTIALKTMLTEGLSAAEFQEYKARFQREAQAAGVLSHPNIVTVYDFGEENGILYLAMECLKGESLERVIEAREILPIETIIPMYEQVCSALDHAHQHKIVHRDVKPANFMILESGLVKVTDFGIAKMMAASMTQAGQILGTPNYMSPEQVKGRPVDGRSDIFSLGVILYELITGEKPFGGQNITTVIYKIINENPIAPRELDSAIHPGLSYITSKALAKDPADRYQTCRQLAEDLSGYKNLGVSPSPGATVVLKAPQLSGPAAEAVGETTLQTQASLPQVREVPPARPLSVQVIPPAKPQPERTSTAIWIFLALLIMGGLGVGYYVYFVGNPGSVPKIRIAKPFRPPETPPAPKPGRLTVTTNVPGAKISIDSGSEPDWISPHTFDLKAGPHVVAVAKDGYNDKQETITVEDGHTLPLTLELEHKIEVKVEPPPPKAGVAPASSHPPRPAPAPKVGGLVVTSNVEEARISLDGKSEPDWVTPHTLPALPAGSHTLTLSKEGLNTENRFVTVEAGHTNPLYVEMRAPQGLVELVTKPPGAAVTMDGRDMGTSPVRFPIRAGTHTYTVKMAGMQTSDGTFTVHDGDVYQKKITLSPEIVPYGIVEVRTNPPGATVLADGTPCGGKTPTNCRLPAGRHKLTTSLAGYASDEREIDLRADETTQVPVITLSSQ